MNKNLRLSLSILFALLVVLAIWYFSNLFTYFVIAFIISLLGQPLMQLFGKIKIRKKPLSAMLRAALSLLLMLFVLIALFMLLIPIINHQSEVISQIDNKKISAFLSHTFENIDDNLLKYGVLQPGERMEGVLENRIEQVVDMATFRNMAQSLLSFTGNFFMGAFSVLFMSFFLLKDTHLVSNIVLLLTPEAYTHKVRHVMRTTKHLLSRYFVGVLIEISCMITIIITALTILGVPGGALIGALGGSLNVIPYLGPIIGAGLGSVLALVGELGAGNYTDFYLVGIKVLAVFLGANLIDNLVLQPIIYSNSVNAHPLEIFVVILMAGTMAGIVGMVTAIPIYTMVKIILGEFFSEFKLVRALTQKMNEHHDE